MCSRGVLHFALENAADTLRRRVCRASYTCCSEGSGMSRILRVRLPDNHWIWGEPDKSAVVRQALELYREIGYRLDTLLRKTEEIGKALHNAQVVPAGPTGDSGEQKSMPGVDPRLVKALDKFLNI